MKLNIENGTLRIGGSIIAFKKMRRIDLISQNQKWEEWIKHEDEVMAYKIKIKDKELRKNNLIIICYFFENDGVIKFWDFGPENCMNGFQSKPEGKYTKKMRLWFLNKFNMALPQKLAWGEIDAFYDPHNLTTSVICTYNQS